MTLLLIVVFVTVGVSATCSLLEATLMSARVPTLEAAKGGPHGRAADRFLAMKKDIAAPTAAILITNTVANTAGATLAGSLAIDVFGTGALGLFSAAFTIAILFLAEIVPKTLGAVQWRAIWRFVVWPLAGLQRALKPAVWVTEKAASALVGGKQVKPTTESEIAAMIRLGAKVGELSRTELELLTSVLRFDEMRVAEVMVPRRDVKTIAPTATIEQALEVAGGHLHTRYPLSTGPLDDADRLVHLKDLAKPGLDRSSAVTTVSRPLSHVPATMPISSLLRQMQRTKQHMALVVDEFGSATGIVTLENLLEEIVGKVEDEHDDEERYEDADEHRGAHPLGGDPAARSGRHVRGRPHRRARRDPQRLGAREAGAAAPGRGRGGRGDDPRRGARGATRPGDEDPGQPAPGAGRGFFPGSRVTAARRAAISGASRL